MCVIGKGGETVKDNEAPSAEPLDLDDDLDDTELGEPSCELGEACESCQ